MIWRTIISGAGLVVLLAIGATTEGARADQIEEGMPDFLETLGELHDERMRTNSAYRPRHEGDQLLREHRFAEAAAVYDEALAYAPEAAMLHALKGYALQRLNQPNEALAALNRSLELGAGMSRVSWLQLAKGTAHIMLGELDASIAAFSASIAVEPTGMAHAGRGMAYYHQNRLALAASDYRAALQLRPDDEQLAAGVVYLDEVVASADFVAQMAATAGAQQMASGIVYLPLAEGSGDYPAASDTVRVHYHGTLRDGTVFDSSVERGAPLSFPLDGVIPCWTEGVQLMREGGRARLVCPADTAYGERGAPPTIPPAASLMFDVELLAIE